MKLGKSPGRVFVVMGDGECAEGSVWEAANAAAHFGLGNLRAIVDINRLGQSDPTHAPARCRPPTPGNSKRSAGRSIAVTAIKSRPSSEH